MKLARFITLFAALCSLAPLAHATKVGGSIDDNGALTVSLIPDPVGQPSGVVPSNTAGSQFITAANTGLQVSSFNSTPTAPQANRSLNGGPLSDVLTQVLAFTDGIVGETTNKPVHAVSVSIDKDVTTIAALAGKINYTAPDGTVTAIDISTGLIIAADGTKTTKTLADIVAAEKAAGTADKPNSVTAGLSQAINQIAANVSKGDYGTAGSALLSAVVKTAATANPSATAAYTAVSVNAIAKSPALTQEQKQEGVSAVTQVALASATPDQIAAIQQSVQSNAAALGLDANEAATLVAQAAQANNPSTNNPTPPAPSIFPPQVDTTVIPISPSS